MTDMVKIPQEAQESLIKMQTFQQQMQAIASQKESLKFQKLEAQRAIDELKDVKDSDEVFKAVGPILIKSKKSDLEKDLKEKIETADVRLKTLEKQENEIKEEIKKVQEELQKFLDSKQKAAS